MCSTLRGRGESALLRSYSMPEHAEPVSQDGKWLYDTGGIEQITIKVATRATSAAPTYFPPAIMSGSKSGFGGCQFWDGGLLNNNPMPRSGARDSTLLVLQIRPQKLPACVLSLGTTWSSADPPDFLDTWPRVKSIITWISALPLVPKSIKEAIANLKAKIIPVQEAIPFLSNTEARHLDFYRHMNRMLPRETEPEARTRYFRLNSPTKEYIDMAEYGKMDKLSKDTQAWLKTKELVPWVDDVAKVLAKKKK